MPRARRMKSRLVVAKVSRPRLPSTMTSPSCGERESTISAPHSPLTKALGSTDTFVSSRCSLRLTLGGVLGNQIIGDEVEVSLPAPISAGGVSYGVRRAGRADLAAVVELIAADQIGAARDGGDLGPYERA